MTDKKQYLFLFSIGPVQSFIAQARKTQDLYAGSQILSKLAKVGLEKTNPKEYIFPSSTSIDSVPNRFLCLIDNEDPKQLGIDVENAVQKYWKDVIAKDLVTYYSYEGVEEQIKNHLDINWVFQEVKNTEGGYAEAYKKIERLLGAVKNARTFEQFNYQGQLGEKGRKCSLDGERNVKFYRLLENEKESDILAKKLFVSKDEVSIVAYADENKFHFSKLQAGEGLSAVSMAKRLFKDTDTESFRSTADIAMLYSIRYLFSFRDEELVRNICSYREAFDKANKSGFNAQLYFEESLTTNYFKKQGFSKLNEQIGDLEKLRKKIDTAAKDAKYPFLKYYAIINFDGDSMGKWLSGENINNPETNLKEFHQKLSGKLAAFAKKAKSIVDNYGQTVYAGGDDFLGFVNLNYLFKAIKELRTAFSTDVNNSLHTELNYLKTELSFAAGICIAHYKEPLSMVLGKAANAQKTAKHDDKGKRNAFSIVASKHSGENHEAFFKWGIECKNADNLETIINELKNDNRFSNTFIKVLNIEFAKLIDTKGRLLVGRDLLNDEVTRLLKRSFMGNKDDKKSESMAFAKVVMSIYDDAGTFDNFVNALNICDFMHRLLATGCDMGALPKSEKELCSTF
jgi:CRISPR-associated protein Cmr2